MMSPYIKKVLGSNSLPLTVRLIGDFKLALGFLALALQQTGNKSRVYYASHPITNGIGNWDRLSS